MLITNCNVPKNIVKYVVNLWNGLVTLLITIDFHRTTKKSIHVPHWVLSAEPWIPLITVCFFVTPTLVIVASTVWRIFKKMKNARLDFLEHQCLQKCVDQLWPVHRIKINPQRVNAVSSLQNELTEHIYHECNIFSQLPLLQGPINLRWT